MSAILPLDRRGLRALTTLALVGLAWPLLLSPVEFRHALWPRIASTLLVYDAPVMAAFFVVRSLGRHRATPMRPLVEFGAVWILSTFIVSNSLCSPFTIDALLFAAYNPHCLGPILTLPSLVKIVHSYAEIAMAVGRFSLPAAGAAYVLFCAWESFSTSHTRRVPPLRVWPGCPGSRPILTAGMAVLLCLLNPPASHGSVYRAFRTADTNGDGVVTRAEYDAWRHRAPNARAGLAEIGFNTIDSNHDSVITYQEWNRTLAEILD